MNAEVSNGGSAALSEASAREFLSRLCDELDAGERRAEQLRGTTRSSPLAQSTEVSVRLSVHKDWSCHARPHLHVRHSERFDVSIGIDDYEVIVGRIDSTSRAAILSVLASRDAELKRVWHLLETAPSEIRVERFVPA